MLSVLSGIFIVAVAILLALFLGMKTLTPFLPREQRATRKGHTLLLACTTMWFVVMFGGTYVFIC